MSTPSDQQGDRCHLIAVMDEPPLPFVAIQQASAII